MAIAEACERGADDDAAKGAAPSATLVMSLAVAFAQGPAGPDRATALKQALATNKAALKQYTSIETTDITPKGEEKKQERKQCVYVSDGSLTPRRGQGGERSRQGETEKVGRKPFDELPRRRAVE